MRNMQTANRVTPRPKLSLCAQSQRTPRDDAKLAIGRIRQNATEPNEVQRILVPARAREATAFLWISLGLDLRPGRGELGVSLGVAIP